MLTRSTLFWLIAIACLLQESSHARGLRMHDVSARISDVVQEIMAEQGMPGLSLAVVHDDTVIFADGFGYARTAPPVPATKDTVYGLASVSKVVTATGFMQLVEQGKIDIHVPVTNYLPRFRIAHPRQWDPVHITSHSLMIHYAGMPKVAPPRIDGRPHLPQTLAEFMRDLYRGATLMYPPYFRYSYSNAGISVLGRIMEVISESDFETYMQQNVFAKLEMTRSSFSNQGFSVDMTNHLAQGHSDLDTPVSRPPIRGIPAGNLHSTVVDMANFMKMYLNHGRFKNHQLLKKETIEQMFTVQNAQLREQDPQHRGPDQGLVWVLSNKDIMGEPKVARHNGKMVGFSSVLLLLPQEKIGVVVLTNVRNDSIKPAQVARAVLSIVRENY